MAVYILEDRSTAIEFVPPEKPSSATLSFKDSSGVELATPTPTVDSTSRTVGATVTSSTQFQVSGALTPGHQYWWTSVDAGVHKSLVRCAEYATGVAKLEAPPAGASVQTSDTITGARITATIPSSATGTRGLNFRAEWTVTGADSIVRVYQQTVHICRTLFRPAVLADEAARYLSLTFPHVAVDRPWGYYAELARRASTRVERKLVAGGRLPHLVGEHDAFTDAGIVALRLELAHEGLVPPGFDPVNYAAKTDEELGHAVQEAVSGLWYDDNDDGAVDEDREVRGFYSMRLVRT